MTSPILRWQYRALTKELLLLEGHLSDPTCPCESGGEACVRKHALTIQGLAEETARMEEDEGRRAILEEIAQKASDLVSIEEDRLCGKAREGPGAEEIRKWRKQVEFLALVCGRGEGGPMETLQEPDKRLTYAERKALPSSAFACPSLRKYPIHDCPRAVNALQRYRQKHTAKCPGGLQRICTAIQRMGCVTRSKVCPVLSEEQPPTSGTVRVTGKCTGTGKEDMVCSFRVSRPGETASVGSIQEFADVVGKMLQPLKAQPIKAQPLQVELSGGTFTFAPETIKEMIQTANATTDVGSGFRLCEKGDGMLYPGKRCTGDDCAVRLTNCETGVDKGYFHTHAFSREAYTQMTLSGSDLSAVGPGKIGCLSGKNAHSIVCAVLKPGKEPTLWGRYVPYIHPDTPQHVKELLRTQGKSIFRPEYGARYEYVSIPKVEA